jgi:hypothetical protein
VSVTVGAGVPYTQVVWRKFYDLQVTADPYAFSRVPVAHDEAWTSGLSRCVLVDFRVSSLLANASEEADPRNRFWLGLGYEVQSFHPEIAGERMRLRSDSFFVRAEIPTWF